jgi:uncharacterized protein (TIGR02117 family)
MNYASVCLLMLAVGCATPVESLFPPPAGEPTRTVYVVNHRWHTGVVVERAAFVGAGWAEDFASAEFLEFGWGDAAFYPAERPGLWLAAKAVLWPTPSVLHVAGVTGPLTNSFPHQEIVRVELSEPGFERLRGHIENTFARDKAGKAQVVGPGLYGDSKFYRARGKFYFPKMCNRWTATGLRAAGCPISPLRSVTAGNVIRQVRTFGEPIQRR